MATQEPDPSAVPSVDFVLSQTDGRPMYAQLIEQVKERIAVGDWPPGTRLLSIREMAIALDISAITVKRAYLELERDGVIVTQQGRGSWVAEPADPDRLRFEELHRHLDRAVELARSAGLTHSELVEILTRRSEKDLAE